MSDDSTKNEKESLFRSEMGDVTPIKSDNKATLRKKQKKPTIQSNPMDEDTGIDDVFSEGLSDMFTDASLHECPEILSFSRSGLQHNILKKLRQGKNPIEHSLDLHGLTINQARQGLIAFLHECESANIRHAIIVHGKGFGSNGKPVIKPMINRWLPQVKNVLAFHSAQPKDGGNGAVYVLLKKAKHK
jgi:DNA-nicking Smr family endonuclease